MEPERNRSGKPSGPPDLDELMQRLLSKMKQWTAPGSPPPSSHQGPDTAATLLMSIVGVVLLGIYVLSGFFSVKPAEEAAVFRLGSFVKTAQAGLHWVPRGLSSYEIYNVGEVRTRKLERDMLTGDESIVHVELSVPYRIGDLEDYLFQVVRPSNSLDQIIDSTTRQVIGQSTLEALLTTGRAKIAESIRQEIDSLIDKYRAGIDIMTVNLQRVAAPEPVKEAFDEVSRAREDRQRLINKALAYEKQVVPQAEGQASHLLAEARAYKRQVVAEAEGESARFLAILPEYRKQPAITRERLSLQAWSQVLRGQDKVIVSPHVQPMIHLGGGTPVQHIASAQAAGSAAASSGEAASSHNQKGDPGRPVTRTQRTTRPGRAAYDRFGDRT